jgi:xanthine/CO dehydrogenase XdhC/CoxF family maturation factor
MRWWSAGDPVGVATVVGTLRSAPRPPGAAMVIGPDGTVAGSVSGGCVEGAVYDLAQQVVASGAPVNSFASRPRMLVFGAIDFAAAARREACPVLGGPERGLATHPSGRTSAAYWWSGDHGRRLDVPK